MLSISHILARQVFDSRGYPTLEVDVHTSTGDMGRAAVPSGASTGSHEALELRDGDTACYKGKGVNKAVASVNEEIRLALKGMPLDDQRAIDQRLISLDGTENKSRLGANALLGVSLAAAKAAAASQSTALFRHLGGWETRQLPVPMINVLNGGAHADNSLDIQEFMLMPVSAASFAEAMQISAEVFHHLRDVLKRKGYSVNVGDEGGFAPELEANEEAIALLLSAIQEAGYRPVDDVVLALDVASTEFYDAKQGLYHFEGKAYASKEMAHHWARWLSSYPIFSIEDPMAEDDWAGWQALSKQVGGKVQLVGDDLFVTHPKRLTKGIEEGIANAILIKFNQIGTLTETLDVIKQAQDASYQVVISHRSGETEDATLADLAVGVGAAQIKTGSMSRTDRMAKYNQLLRIEELIGSQGNYAGRSIKESYARYKGM